MRRERLRSLRILSAVVIATALLGACSTGATMTATPNAIASTTSGASSFVLATLVTGPTETPAPSPPPRPTSTAAPRPTTFPTSTPAPRVGSATSVPSRVPVSASPALPVSPASVTALPRPSSVASVVASSSPARAATSAAMNGTRTYTGAGAAYDLRYPDAWTVSEQSGTVTISPEQGTARIAGLLVEPVANPKVSPEQDLRDAIAPMTSGNTSIMGTSQITPVMVAGEPGFRANVRIATPGTPTARGSATATSPVYVGSIVTTSHKGVNYRIGLLARDGDTATLMQAEQVLASLHFA